MKGLRVHFQSFCKEIKRNRVLFLMLMPVVLYLFVFCYIPMPGVYIAFVNYNINKGIFGSQFVGFRNFHFLILNGDLWRITRNTLLYNIVFLLLGNLIQMIFAIMTAEVASKWFKKTSQAIILLPTFMSMVIVGVFAYNMLNYNYGFVNSLFVSMGLPRFDFYSSPGVWKYIIVAFKLWAGTGYGMIIYLATITGFSQEIYEAAYIDGANNWKKIRYITLPMLRPTFILLCLFSLGGILKGSFDLFYNLIGNNSVLYPQTDIIDTYVFRSLMGQFNFSLGSAVGFYQSFFGLILVLAVNLLIRKVEPESALF